MSDTNEYDRDFHVDVPVSPLLAGVVLRSMNAYREELNARLRRYRFKDSPADTSRLHEELLLVMEGIEKLEEDFFGIIGDERRYPL